MVVKNKGQGRRQIRLFPLRERIMIFKNRADAGRKLAARLTRYADREDVLVLALPRGSVVAVPVSSPETCDEFRSEVDEIVCAVTPQHFQGVGLWYDDFSQTSDEEVRELLKRAVQEEQHAASRAP